MKCANAPLSWGMAVSYREFVWLGQLSTGSSISALRKWKQSERGGNNVLQRHPLFRWNQHQVKNQPSWLVGKFSSRWTSALGLVRIHPPDRRKKSSRVRGATPFGLWEFRYILRSPQLILRWWKPYWSILVWDAVSLYYNQHVGLNLILSVFEQQAAASSDCLTQLAV